MIRDLSVLSRKASDIYKHKTAPVAIVIIITTLSHDTHMDSIEAYILFEHCSVTLIRMYKLYSKADV